jgi:transposase InsO family protein
LTERVIAAQQSNSIIREACQALEQNDSALAMNLLTQASAKERLFYRKPKDATLVLINNTLHLSRRDRKQILIPHNALELKKELLEKTHDHLTAGHLGASKTTHRILKHYFWPQINIEVKKYVKGCYQCQARKTPAPMKLSLTPSVPTCVNALVGIDLVGPVNSPDGTKYRYILVMIDYFSKWATAIPIENKESSTVADGIFGHWYMQYGLPNAIHTDQGPEFTNDMLKHLNHRAGVEQQFTTPYNPSSNGEVERFNRTLINCIACYVQDNPGLWHKYLNGVLFAYRTAVHSATGFTPFYLMFGREARSPIDIIESNLKDIFHDVKSYGTLLTREMKRAHELVRTRLLENAKKMQRNWNALHPLRRVATFSPGDTVLMYKPTLNKETGFPDHSAKFNRSWHGPYLVKEHRFDADSDVYLIEDTKTGRQWSVNVNKLTKYFPRAFLAKDSKDTQAASAGELDALALGRGGADTLPAIEPMCEEVVTPPLECRTASEALLELETVIPTVRQHTTDDVGVTRYTPSSTVSHEAKPSVLRSGRTRVSNQELRREIKRSRLADDSACDYAAGLTSHEFTRILSHGKKGNRYFYVVEWSDQTYAPSNVWSSDVETTDAVEEYWKTIPTGLRPRKFRRYAYEVQALTDAGP